MNTPNDAVERAIRNYMGWGASMYDVAGLTEHIVTYIREHYGYIIKRAVPPCVAHSQVDPDAA